MADIIPLTEDEYSAYINGTAKSEQSPDYPATSTHTNGMLDVPKARDLPYYLRMLVTALDWTIFKLNAIVWIFKYFALVYNVFDNFFNAY